MTIWVDAHLSPEIAVWIFNALGIEAIALRDLGLRDAEDTEIFEAAKPPVINSSHSCHLLSSSKLQSSCCSYNLLLQLEYGI